MQMQLTDYVKVPVPGKYEFRRESPNALFSKCGYWQGSHHGKQGEASWVEHRECRGIIKCTGCEYQLPPLAKKYKSLDAIQKQLKEMKCMNAGDAKEHTLYHVSCSTKHIYRGTDRSTIVLEVTEQHSHGEPPKMPPVPSILAYVQDAKRADGKLTAKIANFTPDLCFRKLDSYFEDDDALGRVLLQEKARDGREQGWEGMRKFNEIFSEGEKFVVDIDSKHISMQTKFMREMMSKATDEDDPEVQAWTPNDVSYGFIRTVQKSFGSESEKFYVMTNWLINNKLGKAHPGFISFIQGLDYHAYASHYRSMFAANPDLYYPATHAKAGKLKIRFIADFDQAQHKGLMLAAGEVILMVTNGIPRPLPLTEGYSKYEEQAMVAGKYIDTESHVRGCYFHFTQAVTKAKKAASILKGATGTAETFSKLARRLWDTQSQAEFHSTIDEIRKNFPGAKAWLDWWTREWVQALFPCFRTQPDDGPQSNNHAEAGNRDEKRVIQLQQRMVACAQDMLRYVQQAEQQYKSVRLGTSKPKGRKKADRHQVEQDKCEPSSDSDEDGDPLMILLLLRLRCCWC